MPPMLKIAIAVPVNDERHLLCGEHGRHPAQHAVEGEQRHEAGEPGDAACRAGAPGVSRSRSEARGRSARAHSPARDEARRFRQPPQEQQRERDRRDAADVEQAAPAAGVEQRCRDEPRAHRTDRLAQHRDGHADAAMTRRRELGDQRARVGQRCAEPEAGEGAQCAEAADAVGRRREAGCDAEQRHAGDQRCTAADAVADQATECRADSHADEAAGGDRREVRARQVPFLHQRGDGEAERLCVQPVEHQREGDHRDDDHRGPRPCGFREWSWLLQHRFDEHRSARSHRRGQHLVERLGGRDSGRLDAEASAQARPSRCRVCRCRAGRPPSPHRHWHRPGRSRSAGRHSCGSRE